MPSIFIRHPQIGPQEVPLDIRVRLSEALNHVESGGRLEEVIRTTSTPSWWGIDVNSTWTQLLKEACDRLRVPEAGGHERIMVLFAALRAGLATEPGLSTWEGAKRVLLDSIDVISGWEHSFKYRWHSAEPVWRESGRYFTNLQGEIHEINGRRTEQEERWDSIANSTEHPYGHIHLILRIISLICIADLYMKSVSSFPSGIEVALHEQLGRTTNFIFWKWQQRFPFLYRRTKWRPADVLCDPEWLASDLVASFADLEGIQEDEPPSPLPPDLKALWPEVFGHFAGQFEFAVESEVRFGELPERWFEFRGRKLRWINRTEHEEAILIIPVEDRGKPDIEHRLALRFLSVLAFATGQPITTQFALVASASFFPSIRSSRRLGAMLYRSDFDPFNYGGDSESLDLPLALYREGLSSGSIYYSFLSFYKVVQLAFREDGEKIQAWIKENVRLLGGELNEWLALEGIAEEQIPNYLWRSCRCAIAHVKKNKTVVDPDDPSDWLRISLGVPVVRGLARLTITSGLFGQARWTAC